MVCVMKVCFHLRWRVREIFSPTRNRNRTLPHWLPLTLSELRTITLSIDGNKRAAYVATRVFLILNGQDIEADEEEKISNIHKACRRRVEGRRINNVD